ncbi:MAG: Gfo/Idh/MocA family oxidoreductase [Candidatus Omnitrophica bacterium]|nr:Gfo/Idh/MocA family oxidoreductase [Candidatus Omnitrophota bacterium]
MKAGVIGLGMGMAHLKGYLENGIEVAGICDTDRVLLENIQKKFGIPFATFDYRDLVGVQDIDIISVASPDYYHREQCVDGLMAGKNVLCEKPLALNLEDCIEIIKAVRKSGKKFMIGQVCRFAPGFVLTKQIIDSGEIGELFFVESEYAHDYRVAEGVGKWRKDPRRKPFIGGGCHAVDLLRWIVGDPIEVFAYSNHKCLVDWPVDDATIAIYRFENGVMGKVFCSIGCIRPYTMRSVFYGTKGTIISDNTSDHILLCSTRYFKEKSSYNFAKIPVEIAHHNVAAEIKYFIRRIENNEAVEMNETEGAKTVATCLAAVISSQENRKVDIREELFNQFVGL